MIGPGSDKKIIWDEYGTQDFNNIFAIHVMYCNHIAHCGCIFFFDVQLSKQVLNVRDISEVLSELEEHEEPKEEEANTGFNK